MVIYGHMVVSQNRGPPHHPSHEAFIVSVISHPFLEFPILRNTQTVNVIGCYYQPLSTFVLETIWLTVIVPDNESFTLLTMMNNPGFIGRLVVGNHD